MRTIRQYEEIILLLTVLLTLSCGIAGLINRLTKIANKDKGYPNMAPPPMAPPPMQTAPPPMAPPPMQTAPPPVAPPPMQTAPPPPPMRRPGAYPPPAYGAYPPPRAPFPYPPPGAVPPPGYGNYPPPGYFRPMMPPPQRYDVPTSYPPKKKLAASSILLLIGTVFIVFAAIAFVAANWNDMEAAGKLISLTCAFILSFGISAVTKAAVKLDKTSLSFFITGSFITAITLLTAGYYEVLGSWFSTKGDGRLLLLAVTSLIVAVMSMIGCAVFKNVVLQYIGFSFTAIAILLICGQITSDRGSFAVAAVTAQLVLTAITVILRPGSGRSWGITFDMVSAGASVMYATFALSHVVLTILDTDACTYIVSAVIFAELLFYGIYKRIKPLAAAADTAAFYIVFMIALDMDGIVGGSWSLIIFGASALFICFINRIIPKLDSSARMVSFVMAALGVFMSMKADDVPVYFCIIVPLLFAAALAEYAFHKNIAVQAVAGVFAPLYLMTIALFAQKRLVDVFSERVVTPLVWCGYAILCMIAAIAALYMRKISFKYHAKHPLHTQAIIYSNLGAAGLALMAVSGYEEIFIFLLVLCVFHFALSCLPKTNFAAIGSCVAAMLVIKKLLESSGLGDDTQSYILFGMTVVLLAASRLIFPDAIIFKKGERHIADVILMTAWLPLVIMPSTGKVMVFLRIMFLAVYAAAFIKKKTPKEATSFILSASAILMFIALMKRPFLVMSSDLINLKINLLILVLLGAAFRFIWRKMPIAAKLSSTSLFVIAFAILIIDGLAHEDVLNRVLILCITALVLVFSFILKSKTWFIASAISLVVLTGYFMYDYITIDGWWIYLLAVGILLVTVAAVNEACKRKGENVISTVERKFSDWTW